MTAHSTRKGILLMILAVFLFTIMDAVAKGLIERYPAPQVIWARFAGQALIVAILLPGMGQVLNGMLVRAWIMIFFTLSLGVVTYHLTTPAHSFIGRHAGG
ncbi:MAG: hypothetical protein RL128_1276, partial [Pseudomonadota bacterium]